MRNITITWHGHSCFSVMADNYTIVLDPYAPGSVPGLSPLSLTANRVLCSHKHGDHGCTDVVSIQESSSEVFNILKIDTWHDDANGTLRGPNRIHILKAHDMRIVHLGDLGCSLTAQEIDQLKKVDVLMIPVGGHYTINAAQAAELVEKLSPRIVIPMHYRSDTFGYSEIGRLEEYTAHCKDVVVHDSNTITVDANTKSQTAVLTL